MDIDFSYPAGSVQLPVGWSKKIEPDQRLEAWADQTARELLPEGQPGRGP